MTAMERETANLIRQHEAIEAHMRFLTKGLKKLTIESAEEKGKPSDLKERITLYRWSLYDFQEAMRRHMELDEQVFQSLRDRALSKECSNEHQEIQRQIEDVIHRAEQVVYDRMDWQELNQNAIYIREAVKRMYEYVQAHITKEDTLLKTAPKNHEPG